jgi:hypothetical protein
MTSDIERLAKESELADYLGRPLPAYPRRLAKFAAMLIEECAKVCDDYHQRNMLAQNTVQVMACAAAIRAKFALSDKTPPAK